MQAVSGMQPYECKAVSKSQLDSAGNASEGFDLSFIAIAYQRISKEGVRESRKDLAPLRAYEAWKVEQYM